MGHIDRIIAELSSLSDSEQARLLDYVAKLKADRHRQGILRLNDQQVRKRNELSLSLARFRVPLAGYRFDRDEANAR
jgi:hypothetical protein